MKKYHSFPRVMVRAPAVLLTVALSLVGLTATSASARVTPNYITKAPFDCLNAGPSYANNFDPGLICGPATIYSLVPTSESPYVGRMTLGYVWQTAPTGVWHWEALPHQPHYMTYTKCPESCHYNIDNTPYWTDLLTGELLPGLSQDAFWIPKGKYIRIDTYLAFTRNGSNVAELANTTQYNPDGTLRSWM